VTGSGGGGGSSVGLLPTVALTAPDAGTRIATGDTVTLGASATDPDGNILSVQFFANGQSVGSDSSFPYTASWTPTSLGAYALVVKALDNDGNVASATIPVRRGRAQCRPPAGVLVSPIDGAIGTVGAPVALAANAVDSDGRITSVSFAVSGEAIGTVQSFPYVVPWVPSAPGVYAVVAKAATDNAGDRVASAVATVNVKAAVGNLPVASLAFNEPGRGVSNPPTTADVLKPVSVAYGSKLLRHRECGG
jgi:chitinase